MVYSLSFNLAYLNWPKEQSPSIIYLWYKSTLKVCILCGRDRINFHKQGHEIVHDIIALTDIEWWSGMKSFGLRDPVEKFCILLSGFNWFNPVLTG